jgi:hypothetical protein
VAGPPLIPWIGPPNIAARRALLTRDRHEAGSLPPWRNSPGLRRPQAAPFRVRQREWNLTSRLRWVDFEYAQRASTRTASRHYLLDGLLELTPSQGNKPGGPSSLRYRSTHLDTDSISEAGSQAPVDPIVVGWTPIACFLAQVFAAQWALAES